MAVYYFQGFSEAQNDFNEEQETQLTQRKFGIEQNPVSDYSFANMKINA